jgi:hypothetical protein
MPAEWLSGNRLARREKRFEKLRVYNLRYLNVRTAGFLLAGRDSDDACTCLQYEKMCENASFVKTTQYSIPDSPRQLLL